MSRKPRLAPAAKRPVRCDGGPMHRHLLYLAADMKTLTFTMKGQTGRYVAGRWEPAA
jgi:hypothetical protein